MMAGKVVGLVFEIISKLDSNFLMTVTTQSKEAILAIFFLVLFTVMEYQIRCVGRT